jgi:hypothetical protein
MSEVTPGPKPGPKPGPAPSPAAMPGAREITPEMVRSQVEEALSAPAPTPQERVAQFERAHEILYEALGSSRREGK